MLKSWAAREKLEAGTANINIRKGHSSPVWGIDEWVRAVSQGKHRKVVLEPPAGALVKREGSLDEVCAVSLSPLLTADPLSHLHSSPLLSITLGCPVSILVPPRGWKRSIPELSSSQMTQVSPGIPRGLWRSRV